MNEESINKKQEFIKQLNDQGYYVMKRKDINKVSEFLANNFEDDPLYTFIGGGKYNKELTKLVWKANLKTLFRDGIGYSTDASINNFCFVIKPNTNRFVAFDYLIYGGILIALKYGMKTVDRLNEYRKFSMAMKQIYSYENMWRIYGIMTSKKNDALGISDEIILKPIIKIADSYNDNIFIEAFNDKVLTLAKDMGFEVGFEKIFNKTNLTHYAVFRKADKISIPREKEMTSSIMDKMNRIANDK